MFRCGIVKIIRDPGAHSLRMHSYTTRHGAPSSGSRVAHNTAVPAKEDHREQDRATKKGLSVAERDAMVANAWKDREGSLASIEFEDGKPEEGYRRNVKANIFRYI